MKHYLYAPFTVLSYRAAYFAYIACSPASPRRLLSPCTFRLRPISQKSALGGLLSSRLPSADMRGRGSGFDRLLLSHLSHLAKSSHRAVTLQWVYCSRSRSSSCRSYRRSPSSFCRLPSPPPSRTPPCLAFFPVAPRSGRSVSPSPASVTQWIHLLSSAAAASHLGRYAQSVVAIVPRSMPSLNGLLYICGTRFLPLHLHWPSKSSPLSWILGVALLLSFRAPTLPFAFSVALVASLLLAPRISSSTTTFP